MKIKEFKMLALGTITIAFASCSSLNRTMKEPNTIVNLNKSDFNLSNQVTAEAKTVRIICIDWARIFTKKTGAINGDGFSSISLASIPVIGNYVGDRTLNYSLYELMSLNPGYDVVFYPQYETKVLKPILGIGFLTKITTVKTTARLGKLSK